MRLFDYCSEHDIKAEKDCRNVTLYGKTFDLSTVNTSWFKKGVFDLTKEEFIFWINHSLSPQDIKKYTVEHLEQANVSNKAQLKLHERFLPFKVFLVRKEGEWCELKDLEGTFQPRKMTRESANSILKKGCPREFLFKKQKEHGLDNERLNFFNVSTKKKLEEWEKRFAQGIHIKNTDNPDWAIVTFGSLKEKRVSKHTLNHVLYLLDNKVSLSDIEWYLQQKSYIQKNHKNFIRYVKENIPNQWIELYDVVLELEPEATLKKFNNSECELHIGNLKLHGQAQFIRDRVRNYKGSYAKMFAVSGDIGRIFFQEKLQTAFPTAIVEKYENDECVVRIGDRVLAGSMQFVRRRFKECNNDPQIFLSPSEENYISGFQLGICKILTDAGLVIGVNNRKIISPFEIDIVVESHKIGIECNGSFFHAENGTIQSKDKMYHLNKKLAAKKAGYELIHVCESDYKHKFDILKSVLLSKFNIFKKRLYGRKLAVKQINTQIARQFHEENHLSGYSSANLHLGLFDKEELVAVASLSSNRKFLRTKTIHKNSTEMVRYTIKKRYVVVGGLSKLIKYAVKHCNIDHIHTFVDANMFNGEGYIKAGFKHVRDTGPGYYYVNSRDFTKKHRTSFMKHLLVKKYPQYKDLTELEIANKLKHLRVWNCGNYVLEWQK